MNDESKIQQTTQQQPKSKRLSSLIWIFVLWGGVRLFSELHPISWTQVFWHTATSFGLIPASILLALSIFSKNYQIQTIFRWSAAFIFIGITCLGVAISEFFKYQEVRPLLIGAQWGILLIASAKVTWELRGNGYEF